MGGPAPGPAPAPAGLESGGLTFAPLAASIWALVRPMPEVDPVTRMTRPSREP